jgi:hypothetical protein
MRFGRPFPEKWASTLVFVRSMLTLVVLLAGNPVVASWVGLSDSVFLLLRWPVLVVLAALFAREFAEKFHRAEVMRASQRRMGPLQRLQF